MTDPEAPYSFRNEPEGGGVLMDLGSHIVSLARASRRADRRGVGGDVGRPQEPAVAADGRKPVAADDHSVFVARFDSGALGSFTASWVTPGRKMQLDFEIVGTTGLARLHRRSASTSCSSYTAGDAKGRERLQDASSPDRTRRPTGISARRRGISSASTISRPSRWRI